MAVCDIEDILVDDLIVCDITSIDATSVDQIKGTLHQNRRLISKALNEEHSEPRFNVMIPLPIV